ncbi:MAG: hypothetical protein HKO03_05515 [Acidimicrobiia bacterium]|nr:hypothetical protein [Acidimicrobiia bacterium]
MRRLLDHFSIAALCTLFGLPLVLILFGVRAPGIENAAPVSFPGPPDRLSEAYIADMTAWMRERAPGRDLAVGAVAEVALALNESANPVVTLGRDGWLYYTPTLDQDCFDDRWPETIASNVARLQDAYAGAGKRLIVVVGPDKASIYPEHLPNVSSCVEENWRRLNQALGALERQDVVRLWEPLQAAATEELVYLEADTHWNDVGASIAARELLETLEAGVFGESDISFDSVQPAPSDLRGLLGLGSRLGDAPLADVERAGVSWQVIEETHVDPDLPKRFVEYRATTEGASRLIEGSTVFLHDSFGIDVLDMLPPYFEHLTAAQTTDTKYPSVSRAIVTGDTVVILTVQRKIGQLFSSSKYEQFLAPLQPGG